MSYTDDSFPIRTNVKFSTYIGYIYSNLHVCSTVLQNPQNMYVSVGIPRYVYIHIVYMHACSLYRDELQPFLHEAICKWNFRVDNSTRKFHPYKSLQ